MLKLFLLKKKLMFKFIFLYAVGPQILLWFTNPCIDIIHMFK